MSNESKKPLEGIKEAAAEGPVDGALKLNEVLSEGPIAEAGAKIIKASDEMAEKVSDEKLEKLTAPIEKLAQKIAGQDQEAIGNIVENATGDVPVTADTSDANPGELPQPPEIPEDVAAGIRVAGSIIENATGADAAVSADASDLELAAANAPEGPVDAALKLNDALSEGPIAEAGAKIIKASDEMAEKVSDEQLEKIAAPIEKLAEKINAAESGEGPEPPADAVDAALKLNDVLSEGPIAEAGAKIIKASDEMAEKVSDEKLEKLTAPIEKLAQKISQAEQI